MGTRSTIALEYADGTVDQIYCHWDGYLDYNGQILAQFYTDPFKVQKLMNIGDMSSLGANIGEQHAFDKRTDANTLAETECTFYGRDRNESGVNARRFKDFEDYKKNHQYEEYEYILRQEDGKAVWYVCQYGKDYELLAAAIERQLEEA